jgi:hypothetical protein
VSLLQRDPSDRNLAVFFCRTRCQRHAR